MTKIGSWTPVTSKIELSVTIFNGFLPSCKGPRSDSRYRYFRFAQLDLSQFFSHAEISQSILIAKKITSYHHCVQSVCIRSFLARISHIWTGYGEIFQNGSTADLVIFTEEILNGKPHFCAVLIMIQICKHSLILAQRESS